MWGCTVDSDAVRWRRSRRSAEGGDDCVEMAVVGGRVLVRDSKDPAGAVLSFDPSTWSVFLAMVVRRQPI